MSQLPRYQMHLSQTNRSHLNQKTNPLIGVVDLSIDVAKILVLLGLLWLLFKIYVVLKEMYLFQL